MVLQCSSAAKENCFQKPINSSDFKQLLTLCLTLRHQLIYRVLVALSECEFNVIQFADI